jgi:hypothetical protein
MSHRFYSVSTLVLLLCLFVMSNIQESRKSTLESAMESDATKSGSVWGRNLGGVWRVNGHVGYVGYDHGKLFMVDEFGAQADAEIRGGTVTIPAWEISGQVASDYSEILWSDGTTWTRLADRPLVPYVEQP